MSQEDLTQFLEAIRQDSSLQAKLQAEGADPVAIAKEAGFSITKAELIRHQAGRIGELSDKDLENLAGAAVLPDTDKDCPYDHTVICNFP